MKNLTLAPAPLTTIAVARPSSGTSSAARSWRSRPAAAVSFGSVAGSFRSFHAMADADVSTPVAMPSSTGSLFAVSPVAYVGCIGSNRTEGLFVAAGHGCIATAAHGQARPQATTATLPTATVPTATVPTATVPTATVPMTSAAAVDMAAALVNKKAAKRSLHRTGRPPG